MLWINGLLDGVKKPKYCPLVPPIMDEDPLGIMLYGYDEETALKLHKLVEDGLGMEVHLMSGTNRESDKVEDILNQPSKDFEDSDTKIMMLLVNSEEQMNAVLGSVPKDGSIPRPIFCGPTPQNFGWKLEYLIEHLKEEHEYWKKVERGEIEPPE